MENTNKEFLEENGQPNFQEVLSFLEKYSWIYKSSNTNFIKDKTIDKLPKSWISYFSSLSIDDFNSFPINPVPSEKQPETLQTFCKEISSLNIIHKEEPFFEKEIYFKKMSPKKLHEISRLSNVIEKICRNDEVLVDFGSGLGYLSEILYKKKKFKILGLECDEERVEIASKRQMNFYPESKDDILYKSEFITTKSENKIEECLKDLNAEESPIGIIGLHSCADLTVTSIRIFLQMERVRKLIVMPCCYHKLKMSDGKFENFPLSKKLQKMYCGDFLNRPFLRLACQETASRWCVMSDEDHVNHGINMFQRAALEVLLEKGGTFKKNKMSKISRDITESYKIECENIENLKNEYTMMLERFGSSEFVAEILTCLQATIQRVCENLVLNDRIVFMREVAIERNIPLNVSLRKIVDDTLSPRCFAFIAQKI